MKKLLSEPAESAKEAEEERRLQLSETFRTADFHDLVDRTHANVSDVTFYCLKLVVMHLILLHILFLFSLNYAKPSSTLTTDPRLHIKFS
jgi:hypothetical protein